MFYQQLKQQDNSILDKILMEQVYLSNERVQSFLQSMILTDPQLFCPSGNKITKICVNSKCSTSLICGNNFCQNCGKAIHPDCPSMDLSRITNMLNERVSHVQSMIMKTTISENQLILAVQNSRKEVANKCMEYSLQPGCRRIVDEIYKKRNVNYLSGDEALKLRDSLEKINKESKQKTHQIAQEYKEAIFKLIKDVQNLKKKLIFSINQGRTFQHRIDSKILQLNDPATQEKLQYLQECLGNFSELKLLFRASQHDFSSQAFHQKCDGIPDTLTLIKTKYGRTIAAFTHYKWSSDNKNQNYGKFVDDVDKKAFILLLDRKEKMVPLNGNHLIYCSRTVGPTFGEGDLEICHECNVRKKSSTNFPSRYNSEGQYKYTKGQKSIEALSGAPAGDTFLVMEYQVYQVVKNQATFCQCLIM